MNSNKEIVVKTPGTCGEFVQGMINGINFLITCPVNLYSNVQAKTTEEKIIKCYPSDKWKAKRAVEETLKLFKKDIGIEIRIESEIPSGKGMASSTADIVGCCLATAKLLNKEISDEDISKIALSIEPSDGIMFKGIVLYDYLKGKIKKYMGKAPEMKILALDLGGTVDTINFNRNEYKKIHLSHEKEIYEAIELVERGIKTRNCSLIGEGATISSILNQEILFKPELDELIRINKEFNLYGICVAHSGTVAGLLLPADFKETELLKKTITNRSKKRYKFYQLKLIDGGGSIIQ